MRQLSLSLVLLAWLGVSHAAQSTLHVPGQYQTIQAGIDAAKATDTVIVAPGTYSENIDFKGKAIHVRSSHGPEVTTIHGRGKTVVTFTSGETLSSVLEGFTITGGGRGVHAFDAGPRIVGNIIRNNIVRSGISSDGAGASLISTSTNPGAVVGNTIEANTLAGRGVVWVGIQLRGGGLGCRHVAVMGNVIRNNLVQVPGIPLALGYGIGMGGGVVADESILANNIITQNNVVNQTHPSRAIAEGGGVSCSDCKVVGNTIVDNEVARGTFSIPIGRGGGIAASGTCELVNNIVRGNRAAGSNPQYLGGRVIRYCNIESGPTGKGNIDADPRFTADGSFHLRHDSPCRNAGCLVLNLSASDFEWDDRGYGGKADIGADEFAPHVYHTGTAKPASTIWIHAIGPPGAPCLLGWSATTVSPPIQLPGVGILHLDPATLLALPLGTFPASGVLFIRVPLSPTAPIGMQIPVQALIGTRLTRLHRIRIGP